MMTNDLNWLDGHWIIPPNLDTTTFDYSWRPDPHDPPYIHEFGTQWQPNGGPKYCVPGATNVKYQTCQRAIMLENQRNRLWRGATNISFDYSWHPDSNDPPYIYQFGTQHQRTGGPRYVMPGATEIKYVDYPRARALPTRDNWEILLPINDDDIMFDYSWHPDTNEPPYIYQFGNQFRSANETPTVAYKVPGATNVKYINSQCATIISPPLTLVYISNGETDEEQRYNRLCEVSGRTVKWVRGINGRDNAIRRAAEISETDWVLVFPAKLWASELFDYNWQPNRWHEPKHYIFYAVNPVNDLCYGHQAAVAYNCQLIQETTDYGLDYTMSKLHDIVPVISGIAQYNSDPLMTWRTAFREAVKLKAAVNQDNNQDAATRLHTWLTQGHGTNAELSRQGAKDGVDYYNQVNGDHAQLMLSFDWSWLHDRWTRLYGHNRRL